MQRIYEVTYAVDYLDPNPTVKRFDSFDEAHDWLGEEVNQRVAWQVEHSPYAVSESEFEDMQEREYSLARIVEV